MTLEQKMRTWARLNGLGELQSATLAARDRLNDQSLGTQVNQGLFRVVSSVSTSRATTVTPLSEWITLTDAVSFLEDL